MDRKAVKPDILGAKNRTAAGNRIETKGVNPEFSGEGSKPASGLNSKAKEGVTNAVIGTKRF